MLEYRDGLRTSAVVTDPPPPAMWCTRAHFPSGSLDCPRLLHLCCSRLHSIASACSASPAAQCCTLASNRQLLTHRLLFLAAVASAVLLGAAPSSVSAEGEYAISDYCVEYRRDAVAGEDVAPAGVLMRPLGTFPAGHPARSVLGLSAIPSMGPLPRATDTANVAGCRMMWNPLEDYNILTDSPPSFDPGFGAADAVSVSVVLAQDGRLAVMMQVGSAATATAGEIGANVTLDLTSIRNLPEVVPRANSVRTICSESDTLNVRLLDFGQTRDAAPPATPDPSMTCFDWLASSSAPGGGGSSSEDQSCAAWVSNTLAGTFAFRWGVGKRAGALLGNWRHTDPVSGCVYQSLFKASLQMTILGGDESITRVLAAGDSDLSGEMDVRTVSSGSTLAVANPLTIVGGLCVDYCARYCSGSESEPGHSCQYCHDVYGEDCLGGTRDVCGTCGGTVAVSADCGARLVLDDNDASGDLSSGCAGGCIVFVSVGGLAAVVLVAVTVVRWRRTRITSGETGGTVVLRGVAAGSPKVVDAIQLQGSPVELEMGEDISKGSRGRCGRGGRSRGLACG